MSPAGGSRTQAGTGSGELVLLSSRPPEAPATSCHKGVGPKRRTAAAAATPIASRASSSGEARAWIPPCSGSHLWAGSVNRTRISSARSRKRRRQPLRTGGAVPVADLASDLDRPERDIADAVEDLKGEGRIRLDEQGRIVGAAGLSIGPDRNRIELGGRTFWTWCAYDILGIVGALGADGTARSTSPHSGGSVEVRFRQGRPEAPSLVLFRPDDGYMSCCANVYEDWCPNSNFFESGEAASTWAAARGIPGQVMDLAEAADLATTNWEPVAEGLRL